ncbi:phosphatidylinositol-3-phosphate-binding protein [Martiniozyma asiatica (nom. inval.)]|nr:phosphatidylinositol-3-phosphate-binding protein [Martiniozyma asiatica]
MASLFKKAKDRTSREKLRTPSGNSFGNFNPLNALNAPTEVAQATDAHNAMRPGELSFRKGDFFHVIRNTETADGYIEIYDPIKEVRGRAPARFFKVFEKTHRPRDSTDRKSTSTNTSSVTSPLMKQRTSATSIHKKEPIAHLTSLFGIVLYDFKAERSDELSVQTGDHIIISAHHDYEWYIAKFVDKIGEVGLVPVSYVQLCDIATKIPYKESPQQVIIKEGLLTIENWKAIKNKHKASARAVGDAAREISRNNSMNNQPLLGAQRKSSNPDIFEISKIFAIDANIESFATTTNNKYWYLVMATMSDGTTRAFCRYYEDFFNYHQKLLTAWPNEGGKIDKKDRILPYIPGPLVDINESLCHKRMNDLNEYLTKLLRLPDYISKSSLVSSFFDVLEGDRQEKPGAYEIPAPIRSVPPLKIISSDVQLPQHQYNENNRYSQSHQDRRSQYEHANRSSTLSGKMNELSFGRTSSIASSASQTRTRSTTTQQTSPMDPAAKLKLKFYYKDDIFAVVVAGDITLDQLKKTVLPRLDEANDEDVEAAVKILPKNDSNVDQYTFDESQILLSDSDLWKSLNFTDKGKFLVLV